jgi:hypothetical protein
MITTLLALCSAASAEHDPRGWEQGAYDANETTGANVVAYWSFDDANLAERIASTDGSGHDRTLWLEPNNADQYATGEGRVGLALVGTNTTSTSRACYAKDDAFNLQNAFAVEMWFKLEPGNWKNHEAKRTYQLFCLDNRNLGGSQASATGGVSKISDDEPNAYYLPFYTWRDGDERAISGWPKVIIPDDTWAHVAFTWDGQVARTYFNGQLVNAFDRKEPAPLLASSEIWIGSYFWSNGFEGAIDSVRVLDHAAWFSDGTPGSAPPPAPKQPTTRPAVRGDLGAALPATPRYVVQARAVATPTAKPPTIDGNFDEAAWQGAASHSGFIHTSGHYPTEDQTAFRVLRDEANLYIAITCFDRNVGVLRTEATEHDGAVYHDDCAELFIDAEGNRNSFYQIAVNANGVAFDRFRDADGKSDASWNGPYDVAASVGDDRWTVELRLPLSSIGLGDGVDRVGFNVAREQRSRDGVILSQWTPSLVAGGGFGFPETFGVLDISHNAASLRGNDVTANWFGDRMALAIATQNSATQPVRIAFAGPSLDNYQSIDTRPSGNAYKADLPVDRAWRRVYLRAETGDGTVPGDMIVAAFDLPDDLAIDMIAPGYRNNIYADQSIDTIIAEVRSELAHAVEISFGPSDDAPTFTQTIDDATTAQRIRIAAADLPIGRYVLRAVMRDEQGETIAAQEQIIRKLAPHIGTVRIRDDGIMIRNGKPFMPIGHMGMLHGSNAPSLAELARDQGVNTIHTYYHRGANDVRLGRLLDEAAAAGVGVCFSPFAEVGYEQIKNTDTMPPAMVDELRAKVEKYRDHPALLGWYMSDEPEINDIRPVVLEQAYQFIAELDPYHPCIMLNDTLPGVTQYAGGGDVLMPDPYILPLKSGPPMASMGKLAAFMDDAAATGRAQWITPQAFDYGDVGPQHAHTRAPTYDELRCMAYMSMAHGSRGFVFYSYSYMAMEPHLHIGMPYLTRELAAIEPLVVAEGEAVDATADGPLHVWAKRGDAGLFIVAVNSARRTVDGTINIGAAGTLHVISEDRTVGVSDNTLRDSFGPYAVHIYSSASLDTSLPTVAQINGTIAEYEQQLAERNADNLAFIGNGARIKTSKYSGSEWLIDGTTDHTTWGDSGKDGEPVWLEIHLPQAKRVSRMVVDATPYYYHAVRIHDARLLVRDGDAWRQVASIKDNDATTFELSFDPVTTDAVRLEITKPDYITLTELQLFGD